MHSWYGFDLASCWKFNWGLIIPGHWIELLLWVRYFYFILKLSHYTLYSSSPFPKASPKDPNISNPPTKKKKGIRLMSPGSSSPSPKFSAYEDSFSHRRPWRRAKWHNMVNFVRPFFSLPAKTRAIFGIQWAEGVIRLIGQMKRENGYVKLNFWPGFWTCTVWEGLLQVRCCESWRAAAL